MDAIMDICPVSITGICDFFIIMKLELESPFKEKWLSGYIVINSDNRRMVLLVNSRKDRKTISYARYLMGVKLGYEVPSNYQVDHINNDKTDDRIENLQLLTLEENRLKEHWWLIENQVCYGFECINCGTKFILLARKVREKINNGQKYAFCSSRCAGIYHAYLRKNNFVELEY